MEEELSIKANECLEWRPNDLLDGDDLLKWLRFNKAKFRVLEGNVISITTVFGRKKAVEGDFIFKNRTGGFVVCKVEIK